MQVLMLVDGRICCGGSAEGCVVLEGSERGWMDHEAKMKPLYTCRTCVMRAGPVPSPPSSVPRLGAGPHREVGVAQGTEEV